VPVGGAASFRLFRGPPPPPPPPPPSPPFLPPPPPPPLPPPTKRSIEAAGVVRDSGETDPGQTGIRYFVVYAWLACWLPRSRTSTATAIRIFPDFRDRKSCVGRNGIGWRPPPPSRRFAARIDHRRRSFCASNQELVSRCRAGLELADMPFECVAIRCAARTHTSAATWPGIAFRGERTFGDAVKGIRRCAPDSSTGCAPRHSRGSQPLWPNAARTRSRRNSYSSESCLKLLSDAPSNPVPSADADRRRTAP